MTIPQYISGYHWEVVRSLVGDLSMSPSSWERGMCYVWPDLEMGEPGNNRGEWRNECYLIGRTLPLTIHYETHQCIDYYPSYVAILILPGK